MFQDSIFWTPALQTFLAHATINIIITVNFTSIVMMLSARGSRAASVRMAGGLSPLRYFSPSGHLPACGFVWTVISLHVDSCGRAFPYSRFGASGYFLPGASMRVCGWRNVRLRFYVAQPFLAGT